MKIYFLSDFFKEDLLGGAESNDSVLINHLVKEGYTVEKTHCSEINDNIFEKNNYFIVSNFISLSEEHRAKLQKERYIIYEHDHKYVKTRDPSVFKEFKIPNNQIINYQFYKNAQAVVVLSKICKEVIEKNLSLNNVYNIGCSLWSDEKIDFISTLTQQSKNEKFAIIESSNPIKNTHQAIEFCKKNNIDYDIIKLCKERELLERLSHYKGLVFFPGVLETFSRISVEAKMLNCKLITKPKLLGAASEEIFELSGVTLIEAIKNRVKKALNLFINIIEQKEKNNLTEENKEDITVILNCYRRPEYLKEQVEALKRQSIKPKQIWIWVNYHEDNKSYDFGKLKVDRVFHNDYNWKYYGRFAAAMLVDTTYVALFDDDTIPGDRWFENCLNTMQRVNGILGGAGVRIEGNQYKKHTRYGWSSKNEEIVEVDLVGHAWFFKQEWMKHLWQEKPYTWENGEDIQFSYCCQKYGGIKTYCPPHPENNLAFFSSIKGYEYGVDDKASSNSRNHSLFYKQRDACVANAIENGWKTVLMETS